MSNRTTIVFIVSLLVQLALSFGFFVFQSHYKDVVLLWTPMESPTMAALEKRKEMFPSGERLRRISLIVESNSDSMLTPEVFNEMI